MCVTSKLATDLQFALNINEFSRMVKLYILRLRPFIHTLSLYNWSFHYIISIFNIEIILGTGKYQEVKRDCIAANGVNNLGISITKQDVENHLNEDCLELKQDQEVVCFCNTDLCNIGNIISSKMIFIAIIAVICLLIIW